MANTVIGRVVATEKNPTTIDNFTFWTDPKLILNLLTLSKFSTSTTRFPMVLLKILHTLLTQQVF